MTTAERIAASRAAHRHFLTAKKAGQALAARAHLVAAAQHRLDAQTSDPEHTDPSWLEDAKNVNGEVMRDRARTLEQIARDNHDHLLKFYAAMLNEDRPGDTLASTVLKLSDQEVRALVVAPAGVAVEETEAFKQLAKEHGIEPPA